MKFLKPFDHKDLFFVIGVGSIAVSIWHIYPPAAGIIGGLGFVWLALARPRSK